MAITTKASAPKTHKFADGSLVSINHAVYRDGVRIGRVLESRCDGKTWFTAERTGGKDVMAGPLVAKFSTLNAATKRI